MVDRVTFEHGAGMPSEASDDTRTDDPLAAWVDDGVAMAVRLENDLRAFGAEVARAFEPAAAWMRELNAILADPKPAHRACQWRRPVSAFERPRAGLVRR